MPADWISNEDKADMRNQGYVGMYKGAQVAILPQYYLDLANTELGVDPSYAWLLPSGALGEKPVKIAFEGQTIVDEFKNYDRSREIQVYRLLPSGALGEKPVKIAFEGQTIVDEFKKYDRSREIHVYKKFGVTTLMTNNICVYQDTNLALNH